MIETIILELIRENFKPPYTIAPRQDFNPATYIIKYANKYLATIKYDHTDNTITAWVFNHSENYLNINLNHPNSIEKLEQWLQNITTITC